MAISNQQEKRLNQCAEIAAKQVELARQIIKDNEFPDSPELLAAIVMAIATNLQTGVVQNANNS